MKSKSSLSLLRMIVCVLILLLIPSLLGAFENGSRMIGLGSWLYDAIDTLYHESGRVIPFTTRPYTVDEFDLYIGALQHEGLSEAGQKLFDRVKSALYPKQIEGSNEQSAFDFNILLSPELYLNTNKEMVREEGSQHYIDGYEYGYEQRLPILSIPIRFWGGPNLYVEIDFDIKEQPGLGVYPSGTFPSSGDPYVNWNNIPMGLDHILHHFPDTYYLNFGDLHWNLYVGSGEYSVGTGKTGNLVLSQDADAIPGIRLSWYNKNFRYNFTYLSLNPAVGNSGAYQVSSVGSGMALDLPALTAKYNNAAAYGTDYLDYMDPGLYPYKGYLTHTMEFRTLYDLLYIGVTESAVYGRAVPELFTFMPLAFWHNGNNGQQTNSFLALDVQISLLNLAQFYFSGVMDQFTLGHENNTLDPEANGMIVGATGRWPVGEGYVTATAEYVYTSDWLYTHRYWMQTPTVAQRNTALTRGGYTVRMLGYHMGNDYRQIHIDAGYSVPGVFDASLGWNIGWKGPYDVFMRLPVQIGETVINLAEGLSDVPEAVINQIALTGHYRMNDTLSVGAYLYWTFTNNYRNQLGVTNENLECTVSVQIDPIALSKAMKR